MKRFINGNFILIITIFLFIITIFPSYLGAVDIWPGDGEITISWKPPTENEDGTPLTDLEGYNIYRASDGEDWGDWSEGSWVYQPDTPPPSVPSMTEWGIMAAAIMLAILIPLAMRRRVFS